MKNSSIVNIKTGLGNIQVELSLDRVPITASNFLRYVDEGLYDGTNFFRTVTMDNQPNDKVKIEVIQGGQISKEKEYDPIKLERTTLTGLKHLDGVISMGRFTPDSAKSSFFICIGDQPELDFGGKRNPDGQGFAAFGRVIKGMEVVKKIHREPHEGQRLTPAVEILNVVRV
jgi:peptidyl-prolyl cis-trans isomerase A (cyclophilin A)